MEKISLIIPTLNEEEAIGILLLRLEKISAQLKPRFSLEIIIIDDSRNNKTREAVEKFRQTSNLPIDFTHRRAHGLATAVLVGFAQCSSDILAVIDADLSHPPKLLLEMAEKIKLHDLVIGSRNMPGGRVEEWPFFRRFGSRLVTKLTAILGIKTTDPMSGYFMLRRPVITNVDLNPLGYKILLEILVKGSYHNLIETPYIFRNREVGKSKIGTRMVAEYALHFCRLLGWKIINNI